MHFSLAWYSQDGIDFEKEITDSLAPEAYPRAETSGVAAS